MSPCLFRACGLTFALLPTLAYAATYTFPGPSPCDTTLQHCIDNHADFSRIEIATNTSINEDITLFNRSLILAAASGYTAGFGFTHGISITSNGSAGDLGVTLIRLGFTDGAVVATYNGSGTATYDFEELRLTSFSSPASNYIDVEANSGTVNAYLYGNRATGVPRSPDAGLIQLDSHGATLTADVYYNHVTSTAAAAVDGAGILADVSASGATPGAGTIKMHGNEARGGFNRGGIFVSEDFFSGTAASNLTARLYNNVSICSGAGSVGGGYGITFEAFNGSIDTRTVNNTASRCQYGIATNANPGASIGGDFRNNLLVAYYGLSLLGAGSRTNDYNLINAVLNDGTLGAHTIITPAQLVLDTQPRLRPASPAIDAADSATLGIGLLVNAMPTADADGLRRFKGTSGKADIGAYESGDVNFVHATSSSTIIGNYSVIDNATLNANAGAALIATPNSNLGIAPGAYYDHPFGAFYSASQWALFNQDSGNAMPANAYFDVLVPAHGAGSFVHVTSPSSIGGNASTITDSSTDNLPDRIVLVTQNWTAGATNLYNPHPVGVYYGVDSHWHVANLDGGAMQEPLGFNVYAQEPSPNAWRVTATAGNLNLGNVFLIHPLLDNTPCARPQVTQLLNGGVVGVNFEVGYGNGNWFIYGNSTFASQIQIGTQFHVVVDPAQVFDCTDRIFAAGFQ